MLDGAVFDKKGRAVVNARCVVGNEGVIPFTVMKKVVLLKRDLSDPTIIREIDKDCALDTLIKKDFCNPPSTCERRAQAEAPEIIL